MTHPVNDPPVSVRPPSLLTILPDDVPGEDGVRNAVLQGAVLTMSRWVMTLGALIVAAVVVAVLALHFGTQPIAFSEIMRLLAGTSAVGEGINEAGGITRTIIEQVRLPRVLLGFLVGCSLASVGVVLQALLRNPLADPYVLGVSSGAALGAALGVLFGVGTTFLSDLALPACGFVGGLMALVIVYQMAVDQERLPIHSLLLAGVILNAIFSALIMFVTTILEPNRSYGMTAWLMGVISAPTYDNLIGLSVYLSIGLFLLFSQMRVLNVLALGDDSARALGVDIEWAKRFLFVLAALITGAVVSISGMIGFVGMVVPHAMRLVVGADHRLLLPASALVGGTFLMGVDTVARTLLAPTELPVGIMTALIGGPFFVYLLLWRKDRMA